MQGIALLLACLACAGNAAPDEQVPPESTAEAVQLNAAQALAAVLLAHEQASAFNPSGLPASAAGQMPMNRQGNGAVMQVDLLGRPMAKEYWTAGQKRQQEKRDKAAQKDPRDMTPEEMNECLEAMTLSNLKPCPGSKKLRKRKGRGHAAGQGQTCGFGNRGQKARSGKPRPFVGFEGGQNPLYRRLPKYVGRPTGPGHQKLQYTIIKLDMLEKCHDGEEIDYIRLFRRRLIGKVSKRAYIYKVLGNRNGKPLTTKNLTVRAHEFSHYAKEQIEANGGKCIWLTLGSNKERPMPRKHRPGVKEAIIAAKAKARDMHRGILSPEEARYRS